MEDVENFALEKGLSDIISLLQKGALVAQKPKTWHEIGELEEDDRHQLEAEVSHRWKHPKALYFTIVMNSIAGAVQGWDQTGKL